VSKPAKENPGPSEQFFRLIFENAQIGVSFFGIERESTSIIRPYMRCWNTKEELSRPEKWDMIVHPEERAAGAERYAAMLHGEHDKDAWEQRFLRPDGSIVCPVTLNNGQNPVNPVNGYF
jgi:two-component system sensor histidine kinase/response regulator